MKSIIIYYSYSGNTKKVAEVLSEYLRQNSETIVIELEAPDESDNFFVQVARAYKHKMAEIKPVNFDLAAYDLICFGTPVWALGAAPAMNTYLDKCFGVEGKDIVLFTTYGSGAGNSRCLNYMQDSLSRKGAKNFKWFSIQQLRVNNKGHILSKIREIL